MSKELFKKQEFKLMLIPLQVGNQSSKASLTVQVPTCTFVKPLPEYTIIPTDTDAEFLVELSREDVEVTWYRNNRKIEKSSRYSISEDHTFRRFVIHNTTREDEDVYSCTVEKYKLKTASKLKIGGNCVSVFFACHKLTH